MTQTIAAIIQARMGSSRFPEKILKEVAGKPLLVHLVNRLSDIHAISKVIIATTTEPRDNVIADFCAQHHILCFRGSENDVLDRHYHAAKKFNVDVIVRITSDCPIFDPDVTNRIIKTFLEGTYDYVSNNHPATFPDGLDTEVFSFEALERAWKNATKQIEREHVTPYIWDQPQKFRVGNVTNTEDLSMKERWTIDYEEDYHFLKAVYEHFLPDNPHFRMQDVLNLLQERPEIRTINQKYAGVNWYAKHFDELQTKAHLKTKKLDQP